MEYYVVFEGIINQEASRKLAEAIFIKARDIHAEKIVVLFSSLGGSVYEGFIIANMIQNSQIPVAMHAVNHIDSIANVIFLSAKERTAESHAKFYLHSASSTGTFDEKQLLEQYQATKTNNSRIAYFISENAGLRLERVQEMMKKGTTLSVQEALKLGIVSGIDHVEIPQGSPREEIIYIN